VALAAPIERTGGQRARLSEAARRTTPVSLAEERLLPVSPALLGLLPSAGLRRGSTIAVAGSPSLALALIAEASAAGSWSAAVGLPSLGLVAAAQAGIALERFALVAWPGDDWPVVTAALLDALDVVIVRPVSRVRSADARRLAARARERGAVLVPVGPWEGADVRLTVTDREWEGLGDGAGHLERRRVEVVATGRGAASRTRRASVWLPDANGGVSADGGADAGRMGSRLAGRRSRAG
jgi:membrane protein implicated in regulation of membrane protease activity